MKQRSVWSMVFALAVSTSVAACGDDEPAGPAEGEMEEEEAVELANVMLKATNEMAVQQGLAEVLENTGDTSARSVPLDTTEVTSEWNTTESCVVSGEVAVDGTLDARYDDETDEFNLDATVSLTHIDCAFPAEGTVFTTNGNPDLEFVASVYQVGGEPEGEQTASLDGSFTWETDSGLSGECAVDLDGTLSMTDGSLTRTMVGTFCGHSIDTTVTVEEG